MREKQEYRGLQIRFPIEIYRELKKRAKESRRSFNGEVVASVEKYIVAMEAVEAAKARKGK